MRKTILTISLIALWGFSSFAQNQEILTVTESKLILLGKTKKLSELVDLPSTTDIKKDKFKKDKKAPNNFANRKDRSIPRPDLEHQGIDPLRSTTRSTASTAELEVLVNRDGIAGGSTPKDPTGSIGLDYYIQGVNATLIGIFEKDGTLLTGFSANTIWSEINLTSAGDPIILYDQELSKWIITEFTRPASLLIAISETSDPLGSYYAYEFIAPNFPDYPKYGIWNDHLVVSTNEQGTGQLHQYFIEREPLMNGEEEVRMQRTTLNGVNNFLIDASILISTPVDFEGKVLPTDPRPMVLRLSDSSWGQSPVDGINMYQFTIDYDDPSNTDFETTFIPTTPYDGFPCLNLPHGDCLPQANGINIAGHPELIMNTPQYRNFGTHESIVLAFITDITNGDNLSGIRWMEIRKIPEEIEWTLFQEGTYAPDDDLHRFLPSIAIDRTGCISIAYSTTSANSFAGLRMTGRCADDPLGEMTVPEYTIANGMSALVTNNRHGDYAHMSVDPSDELTMWFTSEYAGPFGSARTSVFSFRLNRDSIDLNMKGISNLESGVGFTNEEILEVSVINEGKEEISNYEVGFSMNGVHQETIMVNESIAGKDTIVTSFTVPIDLTARETYNFTTYVNYIDDQFMPNDTTETTIIHYADNDAEIIISPTLSECGISKSFEIEVINKGANLIEEGQIEISLNDEVIDTIVWSIELELLESRTIPYVLEKETLEDNLIKATFVNLLTQDEFSPEDNESSYAFSSQNLRAEMKLTILTDESPGETTWQVVDQETGDVVQSGGPYTEASFVHLEFFCLDLEKCYVLTMFDAAGDGLCCSNGTGIYRLDDGEDGVIFNGNLNFTYEDVHSFCPGNLDCSLIADYNLGFGFDNMLGSIFINATGGAGPYSYSIDGGQTFQNEALFDNLSEGEYNIIVLDSDGECQFEDFVQLDMTTSTQEIDNKDLKIIVRPNPTEGVFNIDIEGTSPSTQRLGFQVINATGKIIQERKLARYDDTLTTQISLLDYPNGVYYLRVMDDGIRQLTKIIKY